MATANNTSYYVYLHRKKSNNQVFYVGKGNGKRYNDKRKRNNKWNNIVNKHGFISEIYLDGLQEWYAFELEVELIAKYGRENLCNLTDGGDGPSGYYYTDDVRLKMSISAKKRSETNEFKELMLKNIKNRKTSEETRKKLSISGKNKVFTESHKANISLAKKGKKFSKEGRDNINKARKRIRVKCDNGMEFESSYDAAKWLISIGIKKASNSNIHNCCKMKVKSAYGFFWTYVK